MCKASGCHAEVDVNKIPLGAGLAEMSSHMGEVAVDHAISGGEDYCLLFSVDPRSAKTLVQGFQNSSLSAPTIIGQMVAREFEGVSFFKGDQYYNCNLAPWSWVAF